MVSTPSAAQRTSTVGAAFSRAVASRANHDRPACTGAMSKEIEYIWGLQRVADRQRKFSQEGSKIIKSGSSHSVQLEAKGVPAEIEGAKVLHPSKSSSSAPATCDSKENWDHFVDARQTGSKSVTKFEDVPACFQHLSLGADDSHVEIATAGKAGGTTSRIIMTQHGPACFQHLNQGADDSHAEVFTASKEGGTHSSIIITQQGPACFQHVNRGADDSHVDFAIASKESSTHSRIIRTQQDLVNVNICTWSLQRGVDCQVPNGLNFCVMEARCARLGENVHNFASDEVPKVASESASQFNQDQQASPRSDPGDTSSIETTDELQGQTAGKQTWDETGKIEDITHENNNEVPKVAAEPASQFNQDQQASPRSDPGDTSSIETTDELQGQTAEKRMWDDTGKIEDTTHEDSKATIRPGCPDPCELHETLDYHAKMEACHELEVLEPEHEEMDECNNQESQEEARESIRQEGEESGEDHVILSDREDDDLMCEQDRVMLDAKTTEEDTPGGGEEDGRMVLLLERALQEAVQQEANEPVEEALEDNHLGESGQATGKVEPKEGQGRIYDTEEQCCQEDLMQFRLGDLSPVYVSEDTDEREGATMLPYEQDAGHIAPSHECAETLGRSKPNAAWLADEIYLARAPKALRIHAPDEAAQQTPRTPLHNIKRSLPPKVLARATPKAMAADTPSWDRPKTSCARGFTVPAMPSLKARAQLSMRHRRGDGSLSTHTPPSSPTKPMPEGQAAKPCVLGPEMYSIGTPVPMWDPFCKLSTGLDSQSRQPAPCTRPSERMLRVRLERRHLETTRRHPVQT